MSIEKVKASWDMNTTKIFIDLCIQQVNLGMRKSTSFTKNGWAEIRKQFHEQTGRLYEQQQFKNKYDTLRNEWKTWQRLLQETGIGWDTERKSVSAPDDWWEKKITEVKEYEKFRTRGLQFQTELDQLFSNVACTKPSHWAPSSMTMPTCRQEVGSGDSDEPYRPQTGLSAEFNTVMFNDTEGGSTAPSINVGIGSSSGARTSTSLGVKRSVEWKGKKKQPGTAQIAVAIAKLAEQARVDREIDRARVEASNARKEARRQEEDQARKEVSITGVMAHLKEIPEIVSNRQFFMRCVKLLMADPAAREVFVALKDMRDELIIFLESECNGK